MDRVSRSIEAAMTVMNIMTARSMPKAVYIDDVIERTVQLLRNQLTSTIYPEYDPVYKIPSQGKKKGAKGNVKWLVQSSMLQTSPFLL